MLYEESKMYLLVHCTMLGTFPKDFFKGGNFPSYNFPNIQFPEQQLPKSV